MKIFIASIILLIGLMLIVSVTSCGGQNPSKRKIDKTTVESVDLNRYMGLWYEIARFDHPFERGMDRCTALYTLMPDQTVEVVNSGYRNGRFRQARAKARSANNDGSGLLRVTFFLFPADYRILELDNDNYSYVMVGGNSSTYLWIMSRTPQMDCITLSELLEKARQRGYQTDELIYVKQY